MPGDFIDNYERVLGERSEPTGSGWARFHCPFRGCEGYSKRRLYVRAETGGWCCHHCNQAVPGKTYPPASRAGHGGTWREFVFLVGDDPTLWPDGPVPVPDQTPPLPLAQAREVWSSLFAASRLLLADRERLRARGLDPIRAGYVSAEGKILQRLVTLYGEETVTRAGLGYVDREGRFYPTRCVQPGRILIPHMQEDELLWFVGTMRCPERLPEQSALTYQDFKDSWPKTAGPLGYPPRLYGSVPDGGLLLVTEGQIKAEAGIQRGFPFVGLPGMGSCHPELVEACLLAGVKQVFTFFDRQVEDMDAVEWAEGQLARGLMLKGIPVFQGELPLEEGIDDGQKMDVDSYFRAHTTGEFVTLLKAAARRPFAFREEEVSE